MRRTRTARRFRKSSKRSTPRFVPPGEGEDDRFEQLRAWRRIEAQRAQMPPYVICHDTTLRAIARANPRTLDELAVIPGMGQRRIESHGAAILELLNGDSTSDQG